MESSLEVMTALWFKTDQAMRAHFKTFDTTQREFLLDRQSLEADRDAVIKKRDALEESVKTREALILQQHNAHKECTPLIEVQALRAEGSRLKEDNERLRILEDGWKTQFAKLEASLEREMSKTKQLERELNGIGQSVSCSMSQWSPGVDNWLARHAKRSKRHAKLLTNSR